MASRGLHVKSSPNKRLDSKDSKDDREPIANNSHEYVKAIDAAQSILKKNNPTPSLLFRDESISLPHNREGEPSILETSRKSVELNYFDPEIVKADSRNESSAMMRTNPDIEEKACDSRLKNWELAGGISKSIDSRSQSLPNQQNARAIGGSHLGKSITSSASKNQSDLRSHSQAKNDGGKAENKSGDRGSKVVADPVPSPQGARRLRPQSAQRRRPSLTPNLEIIPEARNTMSFNVGGSVNTDHYQTLNIGDVKNVCATCCDSRWPLERVMEQLLEANMSNSNLGSVGESNMMGSGLGSITDHFTDSTSDSKIGSGDILDDDTTGSSAEVKTRTNDRRPSFSTNGMLDETGDQSNEEVDIDRIGHLMSHAPVGQISGSGGTSSSPGGLKGSLSTGNLSDFSQSMRHGSESSLTNMKSVQASLKVGTAGQISTSISIKDSFQGDAGALPRGFPGLGGFSSKEDSRPSSSNRHRQRMYWTTTGLASHNLYITFFTGWDLHKVTFIASGVEKGLLYSTESELPFTSAREQGDEHELGILAKNLGPVRQGLAASGGGAFPSLDEDREYTPGRSDTAETGFENRSPGVQSRYNIEQDYYDDHDSTSESESEDLGASRLSGNRTSRRGTRRSQLQFERFEFTLGNVKKSSKFVKSINLGITCKPSTDFMVVRALSISAFPGEL